MDLRVLEYFLTVADEENISHAAEILHVTQPTISRQMKELESELGKQLFIRTNKKIILTEEGMIFRQTAKDILHLYTKAKTNQQEDNELEGELTIAAGEIESFDMIAGKIRDFHNQHPKVIFHIYSGNAEQICDAIDKGIADIGFFVQSADTTKYEVLHFDISQSWGILVNKNHRLADKAYVSAKDLQNEKLLVPDNSRLRNDIREWIGPSQHVAGTYTLFHNVMILTEISDWVTICLETIKYVGTNVVFIPFYPKKTASSSMIWRTSPVYNPVMQEFLSWFDIQNTHDK